MNKNNHNDDLDLPITDQPTGEYPLLVVNQTTEQSSEQRNGPIESVKAAYWLSHLESEINRLHTKWEGIDAEFKAREARIAELQKDVEAREGAISRLTAELQRETAALQAADERLTNKDQEVTALIEDRQKRDDRIAALATELADAEVAHKDTLERIAQLEAETARLHDTLHQEQTATATVREHNDELLADQGRLRVEIQDLQIYINGRHDRWSELNTQLADYKSGLLRLEETLKERDAAIVRHEEENGRLATRILDFERQSAELATQRKEREDAYDDLQKKLSAHYEETEHLKAEYAERLSETKSAIEKAANAQGRIKSLELGTQERDQSIEALTAEIERGAAALDTLIAERDVLAIRVGELEKGLTERAQQAQVHHEDLRMSHHQLQLAQQQLADRTTQLASSQGALDQKARHVERLGNDLSAMQKDAVGMRAEIQKLEARVTALDRQRSEAATQAEQLTLEVAARQQLVTSLETELRAKQATEDLLERSLGRITDLGASLADLDQRMSRANGSPRADQASPSVADLVATLAADDHLAAAAAAVATKQPELLPVSLLVDEHDHDEMIDIGRPEGNEPAGKLIVTIGGEERDYPIVSNVMTIGRGHASDIRIASHFVSRLHAKVRTDEGATIIEDAGSKNGVLVNSQRVRRRVLHHGDIVSLGGDFNLRFVDSMR